MHDSSPCEMNVTPVVALPRPPSAYGDRTVSMVRAKYETRLSRRFDEAAESRLVDAVLGSDARLRRGKWLVREDVSRMEALFESTYADAPFLLRSTTTLFPGTKVRPRSWSVHKTKLHASADTEGRFVRLHAAILTANRKAVEYEIRRSTWAWTFHAQERLHERTPDDVRADRVLADAILGAAGMLHFLLDGPQTSRVPPRLALPCGEGLLLGKIHDVPEDLCVARSTKVDNWVRGKAAMTFKEHQESRSSTDGRAKGFTGVTYVGPDEMVASQVVARRRLLEACADFSGVAEAVAKAFVGEPTEPDSKDHVERVREALPDEDKRTSLFRLLRDTAVLTAMGN